MARRLLMINVSDFQEENCVFYDETKVPMRRIVMAPGESYELEFVGGNERAQVSLVEPDPTEPEPDESS